MIFDEILILLPYRRQDHRFGDVLRYLYASEGNVIVKMTERAKKRKITANSKSLFSRNSATDLLSEQLLHNCQREREARPWSAARNDVSSDDDTVFGVFVVCQLSKDVYIKRIFRSSSGRYSGKVRDYHSYLARVPPSQTDATLFYLPNRFGPAWRRGSLKRYKKICLLERVGDKQ